MPSAGFLKGLVIVLGGAIFVVLGLVVYRIVTVGARTDPPADQAFAQAVILKQPAGSEIRQIELSDEGYVLLVGGGGAPDRVIVVARGSGEISQTIWISAPP